MNKNIGNTADITTGDGSKEKKVEKMKRGNRQYY
jgi:hypothetical protein